MKTYERELPHLDQYLISFSQQSKDMWDQLLFKTSLIIRIFPTTRISILLQNEDYCSSLHLTIDQRILFGGILVNYIVEQQIERALDLRNHNKWEDFQKEMLNIPDENWIPSEHIPWLVMEFFNEYNYSRDSSASCTSYDQSRKELLNG